MILTSFVTPTPRRRLRSPKARSALLPLLALLLTVSTAPVRAQTGPQPRLPTITLQAGMHLIQAELAVSPEQQQTGMMFRTAMNGNEGMLFVNEDSQVRCFWMRNTLVPLTIAFITDDGTITNLADMQARSDQSHCSSKPVRYALEMKQGWFSQRGLKAGLRLRGKPFTE